MDNSYFIYTNETDTLDLERFHVCTWEFKNNTSLVEFGFEIDSNSIAINKEKVEVSLLIPWLKKSSIVEDLYDKLKVGDNSRFIFNDSIKNTEYLKDSTDQQGIIHIFSERNQLCLLPIEYKIENDRFLRISVNLKDYYKLADEKPNVYIRFWIKPDHPYISVRKKGIGKSTIIYDFKINERRNISQSDLRLLSNKKFCKIKACFMFNILPNSYDIVFFDSKTLKNIRTLEYQSFSKYLEDKRIKKNELIVVFNKRTESDSFSFFSVFTKERVGPAQFALAILINIICGILLFIPSYRKSFTPELQYSVLHKSIPVEIWIAIMLAILTLVYFIWPWIILIKTILKFKKQ